MDDKKVYIDLRPLAAEKSIFKMALSDRSDGKTTQDVWLSVESFDACGKSATFARRYGTEMEKDFFDQIERALLTTDKTGKWKGINGRDYDFERISKKRGVGRLLLQPLDSDKKKTAITFAPLSRAGDLKGAFDHATHKNLFVDEYIPLRSSRYFKGEVNAILELYRTIDRNHFDNYVMITGNKITRDNPVFNYFGITSWKKGLNTLKNGAFSLLIYSNKGNAKIVENSAFGDLVRGTAYEGYAVGDFLQDNSAVIKSSHSRICLCYVAHAGRLFAVYQSEGDAVFDIARGNMPAPVVCVEPVAAQFGATWLQNAPDVRALLASYKYDNKLFFANEMLMNDLRKVYAAI